MAWLIQLDLITFICGIFELSQKKKKKNTSTNLHGLDTRSHDGHQ